MISTELDKIVFREVVRRVHNEYGIYNQFTVDGDTIDNFQLLPRTDRGYDLQDMKNLSIDIDFLTEVIKTEYKTV